MVINGKFFEELSFGTIKEAVPLIEPHMNLISKKQTLVFLFRLFCIHPIRTIQYFPALKRGELSQEGYVLHVYGPQLFRKVTELCRLNSLKPTILFGSLRGYLLLKGFLPRSEDIDFGFFDEDFKKRQVFKDYLLKHGFKIVFDNEYLLQFASLKFPSLLLDFWRIYERNNQIAIGTFYQKDCGELVPDKLILNYFPKNLFKDFHSGSFMGRDILIPEKGEEISLMHYGPQWTEKQRRFEHYSDRKNWKLDDV